MSQIRVAGSIPADRANALSADSAMRQARDGAIRKWARSLSREKHRGRDNKGMRHLQMPWCDSQESNWQRAVVAQW